MLRKLSRLIKQFFTKKFDTWLNQRMPSQPNHKLAQRNIFILPSRFGLAFIFFIVLLFILGTNYQNNLIILLSYLFTSLFITTMFYSFFNMAGLQVDGNGIYFGFVDEKIIIPINISAQQYKQSFTFSFSEQKPISVASIKDKKTVTIPVKYKTRGEKHLGRLIIVSEYPLGLFKCWTKLKFDISVICFPKALECQSYTNNHVSAPLEDNLAVESSLLTKGDDFYDLKRYQRGEPLSQVAWKQVAKRNIWHTKQHSDPHSHALILDFNDMPSSTVENKLSNLCYLVLQYHQSGVEFGLSLPGQSQEAFIEAGSGQAHVNQCLKALAIYHA